MEDASEPKRSAKRGKHRRRGKIVPRVAIEDRVIKAQVPPGSRCRFQWKPSRRSEVMASGVLI